MTIDYRELLKKFISVAGEDTGQSKVLDISTDQAGLVFTQEEKDELTRLEEEAFQDWKRGKWEER